MAAVKQVFNLIGYTLLHCKWKNVRLSQHSLFWLQKKKKSDDHQYIDFDIEQHCKKYQKTSFNLRVYWGVWIKIRSLCMYYIIPPRYTHIHIHLKSVYVVWLCLV